jgi:hypothetical protein
LLLLYLGCATYQRSILLQLLVDGCQESLSISSGVSSVSTKEAEGPGGCGSGVSIAEDVDGVREKRSGDNHNGGCRDILGGFYVGLPDLGIIFFSC